MKDDAAFSNAYVAVRYLLGGEETLGDAPSSAGRLVDALSHAARPRRAAALAEALSDVARALEARRL
jgi:hypothetical protein